MAEVATPPAAVSASEPTKASAPKPHVTKPERPNDDEFKEALAVAEKEHKASQERLNALKSKVDSATPSNRDSPAAKRQQELRKELGTIREKQQVFKRDRNDSTEKRNKLQDTLKAKQTELSNAKSKYKYKTSAEVEDAISHLQKQVDSGTMKLVDEKKALAEISSLNKQKRGFVAFDQQEKVIADLRTQMNDLKGKDNPEEKALRERYDTIAKELDTIKADQDESFKSLNSLRDQRSKAYADQQEKYSSMKKLKDDYYGAVRAFKDYEKEAWRIRQEKKREEDKAYHAKKRREVAHAKLEEASAPAYQDEILTAQGLMRYFDPSSVSIAEAAIPSKFAAAPSRKVDDSGLKGTRVVKGDEEDYFKGTGGKKGKKGKKGGAAAPAAESKFNLPLGVLEELGKLNVNPPMNQGDVPSVVEKLKEKLEGWKKDQATKTQENIAKAQKEIERLEAEAASEPHPDVGAKDHAKKSSLVNDSGTNGAAELEQEKDAVDDAAEDLAKASIEDKQDSATES